MLFRTPALVITDFPADSLHCCGQTRLGYRWIVVHATAGTNSLLWLSRTSPQDKPVSCHRLIAKDGHIYKIVPDDKTAYTQGPAEVGPLPMHGQNLNNWALSIELENLDNGRDPYPTAQLDAAAAQCVEWIGAYGFIPIVAHAWVQADKHDPVGFDWQDFYQRVWAHLRTIARAS